MVGLGRFQEGHRLGPDFPSISILDNNKCNIEPPSRVSKRDTPNRVARRGCRHHADPTPNPGFRLETSTKLK
jgi:hypothetical protein